jgi:hypothetical protein
MSLMLVIAGIMGAVVALVGFAVRNIREAESLIPDHEVAVGNTGKDGKDGDGPTATEEEEPRGATPGDEHAGIDDGAER